MKKHLSLIIALLFLILAIAFINSQLSHTLFSQSHTALNLQKLIPKQKINLEKGNGAAINIWLLEDKKLDTLKQNSIKYLFVDVGDTDKNGKLKTKEDEIIHFLEHTKQYENKNNYNFILFPYSEINTHSINIQSSEFKKNIIQDYKNLIELGFDGVYLDIEPIQFSQRQFYLSFLQKINSIFPNTIIGVYSGAIKDSNNEWEWSPEYYKKASTQVDFIFAPGYDSEIGNKNEYKDYIKDQVNSLATLEISSPVIYGIPTHKPEPETLENALQAYNEALQDNPNNNIIGISIFAEWTTSDQEWNTFKLLTNSQQPSQPPPPSKQDNTE